ncbi:MAG: hypothetical protein M3Y45_00400 [Actinomycetota bacterium]|nr:hypothetical protein [Actinomycetota bacterium]
MRAAAGQASVEAVAGIAALILTGMLCLQLLAAGYAMTLADGAAEAGVIASIRGEAVEPAVRRSLPGWARSRIEVHRSGGTVKVKLRPPSPLAAIANRLAVSSSATGRPG